MKNQNSGIAGQGYTNWEYSYFFQLDLPAVRPDDDHKSGLKILVN